MRDQAGFKMANQGLRNSSQANKIGESLATELGTQKQNVVNTGMAQASDLKKNVENQRANLISEANVANDPSGVAAGALGTASAFSAPSAMPAIGNAFSNWANMWLAKTTANTYSPSLVNSAMQTGTNNGNSSFGGSFTPIKYVS